MEDNRFNLENGPEVVRLNLTRVLMSDMGVWRCNVTVESQRHVLSGGRLLLLDPVTIGSITVNIQVVIIGKLTSIHNIIIVPVHV